MNLDCLQHPEDVKKEDFGKWNYSGFHVLHYQVEKMPEDELVLERVLPGTQGSSIQLAPNLPLHVWVYPTQLRGQLITHWQIKQLHELLEAMAISLEDYNCQKGVIHFFTACSFQLSCTFVG